MEVSPWILWGMGTMDFWRKTVEEHPWIRQLDVPWALAGSLGPRGQRPRKAGDLEIR